MANPYDLIVIGFPFIETPAFKFPARADIRWA